MNKTKTSYYWSFHKWFLFIGLSLITTPFFVALNVGWFGVFLIGAGVYIVVDCGYDLVRLWYEKDSQHIHGV